MASDELPSGAARSAATSPVCGTSRGERGSPAPERLDDTAWPRGGGPTDGRLERLRRPAGWLAVLATIAALYLGRPLLVPLAISGLFAFLLAPLEVRLRALRLGSVASAILSVVLLAGVLGSALYVVGSQAIDLSRSLPDYRENIQRKIVELEGGSVGGPAREAARGLEDLGHDLSSATTPPDVGQKPLVVEVVPRRPGYFTRLSDVVGPLLPIVGTAVLVLVLTVFLLAYRDDLRDRFIRLVSVDEIALATQGIDEASAGVSRFLVTNLWVNIAFAAPITLGLWLLNVPNAPLWGLLAVLLRFIPIAGVWIAAAFPVSLAFAVFDDWWHMGAVLALYAVVDLIIANVVEPVAYGRRAGLAPLAVIGAMMFWTWLWGAAGLLVAVPLTLCVGVIGRHVPGLAFLDVLVGTRPALPASRRLYQRLLALDADEARATLESSAAAARAAARDAEAPTASPRSGVDAALNGVMLPALALASDDRVRGAVDETAFHGLCEAARAALEGFEPEPAPREGAAPTAARGEADARTASPGVAREQPGRSVEVLLVPVSDEADEVVCEVVGARLARRGIAVEIASPRTLCGELIDRLRNDPPSVVALAGLPPLAHRRSLLLAKRLRPAVAPGRLVVAEWGASETPPGVPQPRSSGPTDSLTAVADVRVHDVGEAVEQIERLVLAGGPRPASASGRERLSGVAS